MEPVQYFMATTISRHSLLVKAFDYLHKLQSNRLQNDMKYEQLMNGVVAAIGFDIGTRNAADLAAHVYKNTHEIVKAGLVNVNTRHEVILTIYRKNKKSLTYTRRMLKNPVKVVYGNEQAMELNANVQKVLDNPPQLTGGGADALNLLADTAALKIEDKNTAPSPPGPAP